MVGDTGDMHAAGGMFDEEQQAYVQVKGEYGERGSASPLPRLTHVGCRRAVCAGRGRFRCRRIVGEEIGATGFRHRLAPT